MRALEAGTVQDSTELFLKHFSIPIATFPRPLKFDLINLILPNKDISVCGIKMQTGLLFGNHVVYKRMFCFFVLIKAVTYLQYSSKLVFEEFWGTKEQTSLICVCLVSMKRPKVSTN